MGHRAPLPGAARWAAGPAALGSCAIAAIERLNGMTAARLMVRLCDDEIRKIGRNEAEHGEGERNRRDGQTERRSEG